MELSPVEVRVLGALIEKQLTTPQSYPLSLNSLLLACNQSTSRHPVVDYDEATVREAVDSLRARGLARQVHATHGRGVTKYRHVADEALALTTEESALLSVLALRGPQTEAELRARTERMADFVDDPVEGALDRLAAKEPPLIVRLPRQPGQSQARVAHLLSPRPDAAAGASGPSNDAGRGSADHAASGRGVPGAGEVEPQQWWEELGRLGGEVEAMRLEAEAMRGEVEALRREVAALRGEEAERPDDDAVSEDDTSR